MGTQDAAGPEHGELSLHLLTGCPVVSVIEILLFPVTVVPASACPQARAPSNESSKRSRAWAQSVQTTVSTALI